MVDAFPGNEKLWEDYPVILSDSLRAGCGIEQATEFYIKPARPWTRARGPLAEAVQPRRGIGHPARQEP